MITWAKVKLVTACVVAAGRRKTTATPAAAIAVAVGVWLCGAWTLQAVAEEAAGGVEVRAKSCSREDIQSAATEVKAAGGGVVRIPEGRADHGRERVRMPDGVSLIGAGRDKTVLENARIGVNTRFYGKLDKPFRISGLHLAGGSSLSIDSCHDFRIDHCTFENTGASAIGITRSHSGLIDHCKIKVKGSYYGIAMTGSWDPKYWPKDVAALLGKPTAIFIEDCEFEGGKSYHATVGHGAIHYVVRHSRLRGPRCSLIDAHGPGWGPPRGTRCVEIYENELTCEGTGAGIRGGGGVFFGNTITNAKVGITLLLESRSKGAYPVQDQVRQVWVWDNVYTNVPTRVKVTSWGGTQGMDPDEYIKENRDYFLRKPGKNEDGFEYVPYTYPHPLTQEKVAK